MRCAPTTPRWTRPRCCAGSAGSPATPTRASTGSRHSSRVDRSFSTHVPLASWSGWAAGVSGLGGWRELPLPVGGAGEGPAVVEHVVVSAADEGEVVEVGGTAGEVGDDVVGVA